MDTLEVLRAIEMYIQSVSEPVKIPSVSHTMPDARTSRRTRHSDQLVKTTTPINNTPMSPYVPIQVWYNSTWEDWAQLDVADILHYPFTKDEVQLLQYLVAKEVSSKKKRELDFWQLVATNLPGRTPLDCKCFWIDFLSQLPQCYTKPIMIRKLKGKEKKKKKEVNGRTNWLTFFNKIYANRQNIIYY